MGSLRRAGGRERSNSTNNVNSTNAVNAATAKVSVRRAGAMGAPNPVNSTNFINSLNAANSGQTCFNAAAAELTPFGSCQELAELAQVGHRSESLEKNWESTTNFPTLQAELTAPLR